MYITIRHKENFHESNYRKFSEDEFITYVTEIAKVCGLDTIPEIHFLIDGKPGSCLISRIGNEYSVDCLVFKASILDGTEFSIHQVKEIVKHELSHIIATLRYNDDCQHDSRWIEVANEIGCEPTPYLCLAKFEANFSYFTSENSELKHYYYLRCSKCDKTFLETNAFMKAFQLFAMSNSGLPLRMGNLGLKSSCCDATYLYHGKIRSMLRVLEKTNQLRLAKGVEGVNT